MVILDDKKKLEIRKAIEEIESFGLTYEEYMFLTKTGQKWLNDICAKIEDFFNPVIGQFPLIQFVLGNNIANAMNNASYAYRLLGNNMLQEDDPEIFQENRRLMIEIMKQSIKFRRNEKKKGKK